MAHGFKYRPKFVDIRVVKPPQESRVRAPEERACDHVGCDRLGACRAPKAPGRNDFWFFCAEHAGEYNRRWNYFDGMSEEEFVAFQRQEEIGHRPVWTFKPGRGDRLSRTRFFRAAAPGDVYGVVSGGAGPAARPSPPRRRLSRLQVLALDALSLEEDAGPQAIRARYAELVKRWHPDSNGGDRSAEAMLQKVVQAYQTLKQAGLT